MQVDTYTDVSAYNWVTWFCNTSV